MRNDLNSIDLNRFPKKLIQTYSVFPMTNEVVGYMKILIKSKYLLFDLLGRRRRSTLQFRVNT
jgi:hypothetical protein